MPGGPLQVINAQNMIVCTACPKPQPLMVTSQPNVFASDQLCATIADCIPMVNILPFGPCALTPLPPSPSRRALHPETGRPLAAGVDDDNLRRRQGAADHRYPAVRDGRHNLVRAAGPAGTHRRVGRPGVTGLRQASRRRPDLGVAALGETKSRFGAGRGPAWLIRSGPARDGEDDPGLHGERGHVGRGLLGRARRPARCCRPNGRRPRRARSPGVRLSRPSRMRGRPGACVVGLAHPGFRRNESASSGPLPASARTHWQPHQTASRRGRRRRRT